eukprot:11165998-Lingulodinium_polyedra.AAC.1
MLRVLRRKAVAPRAPVPGEEKALAQAGTDGAPIGPGADNDNPDKPAKQGGQAQNGRTTGSSATHPPLPAARKGL